jgi:hypothetical protein
VTNKLIKYTIEHLPLLDLDTEGVKYLVFDSRNIPDPIAFTLVVDDKVVACGGIAPVIPGVGECWILFGNIQLFTLCRYIKNAINKGLLVYHRLQMMVREDNKAALRFAEYLGFHNEGVQKCYDLSHNNYIRMARLRDELF